MNTLPSSAHSISKKKGTSASLRSSQTFLYIANFTCTKRGQKRLDNKAKTIEFFEDSNLTTFEALSRTRVASSFNLIFFTLPLFFSSQWPFSRCIFSIWETNSSESRLATATFNQRRGVPYLTDTKQTDAAQFIFCILYPFAKKKKGASKSNFILRFTIKEST